MCENYSLTHICPSCQNIFLKPSLYKRKINYNIEVISFYKYEEIKKLLHTKHTDVGFYVYKILAQNSLQKFAEAFDIKESLASIAIDDRVEDDYSHTAILNKSLKTSNIQPYFGKLRAKNRVSYSGKSRRFREENPRNFQLKKFKQKDVILVDDIITTGATLNEAIEVMRSANKEVLLCLTLCDVSKK